MVAVFLKGGGGRGSRFADLFSSRFSLLAVGDGGTGKTTFVKVSMRVEGRKASELHRRIISRIAAAIGRGDPQQSCRRRHMWHKLKRRE
jgi:hypothetical protein